MQSYVELIDRIVAATLQGQIRSKEQVYQMLQAGITAGTGELFERCLQAQIDAIQAQILSADELQQAKATRKQRALKTIQTEWERWQKQNQSSTIVSALVETLIATDREERLSEFLRAIDPNQSNTLTRQQLQQLVHLLQQTVVSSEVSSQEPESDTASFVQEITAGILQGLQSWQELEGSVVGWIFEQSQGAIGFDRTSGAGRPWHYWAKLVSSDDLKRVFQDLALHQMITDQGVANPVSLATWVELALVLQRLQLGLGSWFDKQPYDPTAGRRLSIATFLTFTVVWSQLSQRFSQLGQRLLATGSFQLSLQTLYRFAQQDYFPLYGGLFTALSGESLRTMLNYLDQPLRQVPNTQSKARIVTLLGYSQRALGLNDQALQLHQWALEIAREAVDRRCEVANLNHLSRTRMGQQNYTAAIDDSQRALILARQTGDRLGEANALANLGCSEVFQAQDQPLDAEQYERLLDYLQRGLQLSEREGDRPSQALCAHSLGIAQFALGQYEAAIDSLSQGLTIAQAIGDSYLQGINCTYLAEACRLSGNPESAIYIGCLGMYGLYQIGSQQWRQPAGMLNILYGQLGVEAFRAVLADYRPQFLQQIGVDGYDYLLTLLTDYQQTA